MQLLPLVGSKGELRGAAGGLQVQDEILSRSLGPSNDTLSEVCELDQVAALQAPDMRTPKELP